MMNTKTVQTSINAVLPESIPSLLSTIKTTKKAPKQNTQTPLSFILLKAGAPKQRKRRGPESTAPLPFPKYYTTKPARLPIKTQFFW
jgi:hypothetical protein